MPEQSSYEKHFSDEVLKAAEDKLKLEQVKAAEEAVSKRTHGEISLNDDVNGIIADFSTAKRPRWMHSSATSKVASDARGKREKAVKELQEKHLTLHMDFAMEKIGEAAERGNTTVNIKRGDLVRISNSNRNNKECKGLFNALQELRKEAWFNPKKTHFQDHREIVFEYLVAELTKLGYATEITRDDDDDDENGMVKRLEVSWK